MPRHLISDAHEWINETRTVPNYYLAKPQPRERAWQNQRGKKTLLSLTLVSVVERGKRCSIGGRLLARVTANEIPPLLLSRRSSDKKGRFLPVGSGLALNCGS